MSKNSEDLTSPHIRGSIVGPTKSWLIKTYGRDLYDAALKSLSAGERSRMEAEILPVSWFPIDTWERFVDAAASEVNARTGEDSRTFNRRMVLESGQTVLTKVYRVVFSLFDPRTVISRALPLYRRVYSHGTVDITRNEPGHWILTYAEMPETMVRTVRRTFPGACELVLHLAGQKMTDGRIREQKQGLHWTVDYDVHYQKE